MYLVIAYYDLPKIREALLLRCTENFYSIKNHLLIHIRIVRVFKHEKLNKLFISFFKPQYLSFKKKVYGLQPEICSKTVLLKIANSWFRITEYTARDVLEMNMF